MSMLQTALNLNNRTIECLEEELTLLKQENYFLKAACVAAIYPLRDWIKTTGFGEVNKRDKQVLEMILLALNYKAT